MANVAHVVTNGARIPALGFGTYGMRRAEMLRIIPAAIQAGFRHFDTAQMDQNESELGECVKHSGIDRREFFLTTKVWVANYPPSLFAPSVDQSLQRLRTDYIDLLLLHWPSTVISLADQLGEMSRLVTQGKVRHIGVSNFNAALVAQAARLSTIPLATNQFEYHPFLRQTTLVDATRRTGMAVTAYCAMAIGRVFDNPTLLEIAANHSLSVAQIVLRWLVQQNGVVALSRSTNPKRLASNIDVFGFSLAADEMAAVSALARPGSRIVDPAQLAPAWD
jgi:2,5-diketo-D-gluconate reductase B